MSRKGIIITVIAGVFLGLMVLVGMSGESQPSQTEKPPEKVLEQPATDPLRVEADGIIDDFKASNKRLKVAVSACDAEAFLAEVEVISALTFRIDALTLRVSPENAEALEGTADKMQAEIAKGQEIAEGFIACD